MSRSAPQSTGLEAVTPPQLILLVVLNLCRRPLPLAATSDTLPTLHQTCNSGQPVAPGRLRTEVVSGRRALWSRQAPYLTTASQLRGLYTDDKNCHRDTGLHVSVGEEMLCRPELAKYSNLCR